MIRKNIQNILSVLVLLFFITGAHGQETNPVASWGNLLEDKTAVTNKSLLKSSDYYLVHWEATQKEAFLRNEGFVFMRRLDATTAVVRYKGNLSRPVVLRGLSFWNVKSDWKLSVNLTTLKASDFIDTYMIKSEDVEAFVRKLKSIKADYKRLGEKLFRVTTTGSMIRGVLLPLNHVTYIGKESQQVSVESRVLDMNLNPNTVNRIHNDFPALKGEGMTLSIREGMFDFADMDIRLRHLESELEGDEFTLHATEMATIAAGAGNSSLNGKGVAGAAVLTGSLLEELVPDADADYQQLNAWVQNHSYGTNDIENFYGASAEAYDQSANNNPQLLHVFSAGNLGASAPEEGAYFGSGAVANMTGNFKMSKNTLSVASVDTVGKEVLFVSKGPAHDGRIKPELVTYSVAGSSNSAAMVSGVSILLQQAYLQMHGEVPASALLKALLINSAVDVLNVGPDYTSGYGNVDAYRTLNNLNSNRFFKGSVAHGENQSFDFTIPENAINLKVTLVWNDPAAEANANIALVNDLDLKLTDASGQEFNRWVLNPDSDHLTDLAVRGIDRLNNVEQVTVRIPAAGSISVEVSASNIPEGVQDFYIAYQSDVTGVFDWSFPTGSDNMPYNGETVSYFRWKSTLAETVGRLEYSIDNGASWKPIDNEVSLAQGHYRWNAPDVRSTAIARMVVGAQTFPTEIFTISRPERISVGFSCADSVRLQWNQVAEAESYEIFTFGDAFLQPVASIIDTSFTFNKSSFSTNLFTVQPVLAGGGRAVRAPTFDYDFQGVGCYLVSFFTQAEGDDGVRVNVGLGTIAGVNEVVIERQVEQAGFKEIASISGEALALGTDLLDRSPAQGLNEYRAQIRFKNGEEISTEVSSVYFLTTDPFLVFPNPVPRGDRLNVFSKVFTDNLEVKFSMYNHAGIPLFDLQLNSERISMGLDRLKAGIYFYRITAPGYNFKGRVILE